MIWERSTQLKTYEAVALITEKLLYNMLHIFGAGCLDDQKDTISHLVASIVSYHDKWPLQLHVSAAFYL